MQPRSRSESPADAKRISVIAEFGLLPTTDRLNWSVAADRLDEIGGDQITAEIFRSRQDYHHGYGSGYGSGSGSGYGYGDGYGDGYGSGYGYGSGDGYGDGDGNGYGYGYGDGDGDGNGNG
jgi:hypothetical protein